MAKRRKTLEVKDLVNLDGIIVGPQVDGLDPVPAPDHQWEAGIDVPVRTRKRKSQVLKQYGVDKITISKAHRKLLIAGDVTAVDITFEQTPERRKKVGKKHEMLPGKTRTRRMTVHIPKDVRQSIRNLDEVGLKDMIAVDAPEVTDHRIKLQEAIEKRILREARHAKFAKHAAVAIAVALAAPTALRAVNVGVDNYDTDEVHQVINRTTPTTVDGWMDVAGDLYNASGTAAAVNDFAQSVTALADVAENFVTPWRDYQVQGNATFFGGTPFQDNLIEMQQRASDGGFMAFSGEPQEVRQYRQLLRTLAVKRSDGSVQFHDQIQDLSGFAVRAREAGYDPALALALANIVYSNTTDGSSREVFERRLTQVGTAYLTHANTRLPLLRTADTDYTLQLIAAAQFEATGMARNVEQGAASAPEINGDLSLTDSRVLQLAERIISLAADPESTFTHQAGTEFNVRLLDQAYVQMAEDPQLLKGFLRTRAIGLGDFGADVLTSAMVDYPVAERVEIIETLITANTSGEPRQIQMARAAARAFAQPDQQFARIWDRNVAQPFDRMVHGVQVAMGWAEEARVIAHVEEPRIALANTAVSLVALSRSDVGRGLLERLTAAAPEGDAFLSIANDGSVDDMTTAIMLRALRADGDLLQNLLHVEEGDYTNEVALQRAARMELQRIGVNMLVDERYGASMQLLVRGSLTDGTAETPAQMSQRFGQVVDQIDDFCQATDMTTVSGRLRQQISNLYSLDNATCGGLMLYVSANEGNIHPYNPPLLNTVDNPDSNNWRHWAAPVFGWNHFIPGTTAISMAYAYVPQIMVGAEGSRFVDLFRDEQTGIPVEIERGTDGQLTEHAVLRIVFDAAYGDGASYHFDDGKLRVKRADSEHWQTLDLSQGVTEAVIREVSGNINTRLARVNAAGGDRDHTLGSRHRQAFVPLADFHRRGGDVTTLTGNVTPHADLSLSRLVALNYDLQVAQNMLAGEFVALHGDLSSHVRTIADDATEADRLAVMRYNAALIHGGHVFGDDSITGLRTNSWSNVFGASRNRFMTRHGAPRAGQAARAIDIGRMSRSYELVSTIGRTDGPDLAQSGYVLAIAERAASRLLGLDEEPAAQRDVQISREIAPVTLTRG